MNKKQMKKEFVALQQLVFENTEELRKLNERADKLEAKQMDDDAFIRTKCVAQAELIEQLTKRVKSLELNLECAEYELEEESK